MSLLSRLFSPRKTLEKCKSDDDIKCTLGTRASLHTLNKEEVRVLLFRECDWRGRKLLFDNTCVEKVAVDLTTPHPRSRSNSLDAIIEVSNGYGYKYKKPHSDTSSLGETVFGSIAMATRGPSLKVHLMKDPSRIMFTKVFQTPRSGGRRRYASSDKNMNDSQGSSVHSMGDCKSGSFESRPGSFEVTPGDSGIGGRDSSECFGRSSQLCTCPLHQSASASPSDDIDRANSGVSLQSGGSLCSLRRRWARSAATALDLTDWAPPLASPAPGRRTKLAVAFVVPLPSDPAGAREIEQFLLDRLPVLSSVLMRLQHSTEHAYSRRDSFVHAMYQASAHATQSVYELVCGMQLDRPLWLTLTDSQQADSLKDELERKLVSDLAHLLATLDTKDTNFFMSTLLTAVLTHHLGWVPTVLNDLPLQSNNMLAELGSRHPYDALWAVAGELRGEVGWPVRSARTLVVGQSHSVVRPLLSVLSYFVRCGRVCRAATTDPQAEAPGPDDAALERLVDRDADREAFAEFCKADSFGGSVSTSSTATLIKSKTTLSLKTFSIEGDAETGNSFESGFESFDDTSAKCPETKPFAKSKSCARLMETSFLERDQSSWSDVVVARIEATCEASRKTENERQFACDEHVDVINLSNSKPPLHSKRAHGSFIKDNLVQADRTSSEDKNKVVFVLGENEELVNLKPQGGAIPPKILIDPPPADGKTEPCLIVYGSAETEVETGFMTGDVSDRVVIARSTPIDISAKNPHMPNFAPLHRCLSVPEEAVSDTEWAKSRRRRSREVASLIRRWFSDSVIAGTCCRSERRGGSCERRASVGSGGAECEASDGVLRTGEELHKVRVLSGDHSPSDGSGEKTQVVFDPGPSCCEFDDYVRLPAQRQQHPRSQEEVGVAASLLGGLDEHFRPDMVLQAARTRPPECELRRALMLDIRASDLPDDAPEAVCVVADTGAWEVTVVLSHTPSVHPGSGGLRIGPSQLVANMLEGLQQLASLAQPPSVCLAHVEHKLYELCTRSHALSELLLESDFLDMASVTSALAVEPDDVPLLLSVASVHTPAAARKYGLSYQ